MREKCSFTIETSQVTDKQQQNTEMSLKKNSLQSEIELAIHLSVQYPEEFSTAQSAVEWLWDESPTVLEWLMLSHCCIRKHFMQLVLSE